MQINTHTMKYILFIAFSLLIVLASCHKEKEYFLRITPDLLNCCFKTNSYWVYIDSVSNTTDSVYVEAYGYEIYQVSYTDYSTTKSEYFSFRTKSSSETTGFIVEEDNLRKTGANNSITTIYVDYNKEYSEHLDSTYIYDRYYYRVLKVVVAVDETEENNTSIYYTNSDYGILRHDIYSDTVLLSSKVLMRKDVW